MSNEPFINAHFDLLNASLKRVELSKQYQNGNKHL